MLDIDLRLISVFRHAFLGLEDQQCVRILDFVVVFLETHISVLVLKTDAFWIVLCCGYEDRLAVVEFVFPQTCYGSTVYFGFDTAVGYLLGQLESLDVVLTMPSWIISYPTVVITHIDFAGFGSFVESPYLLVSH